MITFNQIIGGCIAVIMAGMPAMIALLKIEKLRISVNGNLHQFIAANKAQADERIKAAKAEADARLQDLRAEMVRVTQRNDQLFQSLVEALKRFPVPTDKESPPS
jgi:hypothetical protein